MIELQKCTICGLDPKVDVTNLKICVSCCKLRICGKLGTDKVFEDWNIQNQKREQPTLISTSNTINTLSKTYTLSNGKPFIKQRTTR